MLVQTLTKGTTLPIKTVKLQGGLNPRQLRFATEYAKHENYIEAYKNAGYSWCDSNGEIKPYAKCTASKLVHNPKVAREIERIRCELLPSVVKQGSHTVEYVRAEHLRQYHKLETLGVHGTALQHLRSFGETLGAYTAGSTTTIELQEISGKRQREALRIARVLLTTRSEPVQSRQSAPESTNATRPMLTLGGDGKLALPAPQPPQVDVSGEQATGGTAADTIENPQDTPEMHTREGYDPPRPPAPSLKLPPPTCIQNLGSSYCFGVAADIEPETRKVSSGPGKPKS